MVVVNTVLQAVGDEFIDNQTYFNGAIHIQVHGANFQ